MLGENLSDKFYFLADGPGDSRRCQPDRWASRDIRNRWVLCGRPRARGSNQSGRSELNNLTHKPSEEGAGECL